MKQIKLEVQGIPRPQERPRTFSSGYRSITYSPKTVWYAHVLARANMVRPKIPMSGPIRLDLTFFMPRPKSEPTAYWMSKRPDKDNLAKVIMDALTKAGWWHDDGQVCSGWINKRYPPEGGSVGVEIMAEEIE